MPKDRGSPGWGGGRRADARLLRALVLAFVAFNAIFDVRILLAIEHVVAAAEEAAARGSYVRIQDHLGTAAHEGLMLGGAAAALILAGGAVSSLRARRAAARGGAGR